MEFNLQNVIEGFNFTSTMWQIATPMIFSLADIITGYIQAVINHDVDSQKMRNGLLHKTLIMIIIILSFVVHFAFNLFYVSKFVCIYVILMESVSILENLQKAGVNVGKLGIFLKEKTTATTEESFDKLVTIFDENIKDKK